MPGEREVERVAGIARSGDSMDVWAASTLAAHKGRAL